MLAATIHPSAVQPLIGTHDSERIGECPSALAAQLCRVQMSSHQPVRAEYQPAARTPLSTTVEAEIARGGRTFGSSNAMGATSGVDFAEPLEWLQGSDRYTVAVQMLADKLVDFANNLPSGWHFDLHQQAQSAMVNFYLSHISPKSHRRYDRAMDDVLHMASHSEDFSRLFFLASSTPIAPKRLKDYAERWLARKTHKSGVCLSKSRLQRLFEPSRSRVSASKDVIDALTKEVAQSCGADCPDTYAAALFCVTSFRQMINHTIMASVSHPTLRVALHLSDATLIDYKTHLNLVMRLCQPDFGAKYLEKVMMEVAIKTLNYLKIDTLTSSCALPSAPPLSEFDANQEGRVCTVGFLG